MTPTPDALAGLCAQALPHEHLTADELQHVCFGPHDEQLGDSDAALALTLKDNGGHRSMWIVLVVVTPDRQGEGLGTALVRDALSIARERGATRAHLANSVPRYLWPGVEITNTRAGMLFEALGFERDLVGINMVIPTAFRRPAPRGVVIEREFGPAAIDFAVRAYPNWVAELEVAIDRGTAFAARTTAGETIGFGCHSCNRTGWIGPIATDPTSQHGGVGSAVLAAACEDLELRGHDSAEISWVSNLRFYGKCGATVSRVFQGWHLALD
ncbi:MAG: GNAT family N-acetyltransferase [Acidimicrobiia bacterium]